MKRPFSFALLTALAYLLLAAPSQGDTPAANAANQAVTNDSILVLYKAATKDMDAGNATDALAKMDELVADVKAANFPISSAVLVRRAEALTALNRNDEALGYLDEIAKLNERTPKEDQWLLYNQRALTLIASGRYAEAVEASTQASKLTDKKPPLYNRATAKWNMGDKEGALADWQLTGDTNKPDWDEAYLPINKKIGANPGKAAPLVERALFRLQQGRQEKTDFDLDDVLFLVEGHGGWDHNKDLFEAVLADLNTALWLEPKDMDARLERAKVRLAYLTFVKYEATPTWDADDMLMEFAALARDFPKNPAVWAFSAQAYFTVRSHIASPTPSQEEQTKAIRAGIDSGMSMLSRAIYLAPTVGELRWKRLTWESSREKSDPYTLIADSKVVVASKCSPLGGEGPLKQLRDFDTFGRQDEDVVTDARTLQVESLAASGDANAAIAALDELIKTRSTAEYLLRHADLCLMVGKSAQVLADVTPLTTSALPNISANAWMLSGMAHDQMGDTATAQQEFDKASQILPQVKDKLKNTRYGEPKGTNAVVQIVPGGKVVPAGTALSWKEKGNTLNNNQAPDAALEDYYVALRIDPKYADAQNNIGSVYSQQRKWDLAIDAFTKALLIDPKHKIAASNRAFVWDQLDETDKAIADAKLGVANAQTPETKAKAMIDLASYQLPTLPTDSLKTAQGIQKQYPQNLMGWVLGALGHFKLDQTEAALSDAGKASELEPNGRCLKAFLLATKGDATAQSEWDAAKAKLDAKDKPMVNAWLNVIWRKVGSNALLSKWSRELS